MRCRHRFGRVGLALFLIPVFLSTALLYGVAPADAAPAKSSPPTQQPAPSPSTSVSETPALDVPEDPLSQRSEQQAPEISIAVDVRDGHLIVRVVDVWGPGRVPLVTRSWTGVANSPSGAGYWQFNHHLNVTKGQSTVAVLEPDGNQGVYKNPSRNCNTAQTECWDTYAKDIGTYGTLVVHNNCVLTGQEGNILTCTPDAYTVNMPKGVTQQFGNNGLITRQQDANGNTTTYAWTSLPSQDKPYVATVTDPVGRITTYAYEASGTICVVRSADGCRQEATVYRLKTATDPYGQVATYTYDALGRLASVRNPAGFTTQYGYDPTYGRLTSVIDARGQTTNITWTVVDIGSPVRVSQITAPDGTTTAYSYTGNPVTKTVVTDARAKQTTYEMNVTADNSDLVKVTDPLLNITQYAYDLRHNVTQVTDALGRITTIMYNTHNKVIQIVRDSGAGNLNLRTDLTWDSVDALPYNGKDNLLSVTNPRTIRTDYTYDTKNNLISVRRAVGTVDESLTQQTYTTWGGVASVIDPRGNTTTFVYTARHQLQTVTPPAGGATAYGYDPFDNQVSMTDGNGHAWQTAYDVRRLVTSATDPAGNEASFEYDGNGNRTRAVDAKFQATSFSYDSRNRLTAITDPLNDSTHPTGYLYDAVGNLLKVTNARNFATNFEYDAANRLTKVTDALTQGTTYGYDAVGNRTSLKDRKLVPHSYQYDAVNRLTQVSAGGIIVSYTYDADSSRLTMIDSTGTTNYTYDSLDRLIRMAYPDGKSIQYGYDRASNRASLTYPGGTASLTYAYDGANRLSQITQGTLQWTFTHDGAGNRIRLTQPNGTQTVYAYLMNNWLSSISHQSAGGTPFEAISYTYDANGNRISQTDISGTSSYGYDLLNRLINAAYPGTYGTWSWAYDAVGNRTQQVVAPAGTTTNYTYDGNNRLTQAGGVVYTYDANGNLTGTTAGQSFTYDVFNRMTQAVGTGGTATYTYNGDGRKIQRVGPDGVTRYYYSGIRPIWETDGAGVMTAELDRDIFGNLLSRLDSSGIRRYYHPDGLGSTIVLTDGTGNFSARTLYDAWGNVRATTADVGKYRFTGAELDTASGLYHMGARFYDPTIGRWLGEDPAQGDNFNPSTLNYYAYADNNPSIFVDPDGKVAVPVVIGGVAVVVLGGIIVFMGSPDYQRSFHNALKYGGEAFDEWLGKLIEKVLDSVAHHGKNRDWQKVNAGDPGHIQEMRQEIVNLDKRIKELEMALNSGKLDKEQKRRVERVLEATQKVRDAYQAAVDQAEKSQSPSP